MKTIHSSQQHQKIYRQSTILLQCNISWFS